MNTINKALPVVEEELEVGKRCVSERIQVRTVTDSAEELVRSGINGRTFSGRAGPHGLVA